MNSLHRGKLLPVITAAGLATADSIQQKTEQGIHGDPNRYHWAGGEEEPEEQRALLHRSVFPGKQKENKPLPDFNSLTMQMYSGPAGHFWLYAAT